MAKPEGHAVDVAGCWSSRKPCGPSFIVIGGMPRRGVAFTFPTYAQLWL